MGEIDQVGQRLKGREGDNEAWFSEWHALGADMERKAEAAAAANHQLTAGTYYLHAGVYYLYSERFIPPSERKWAATMRRGSRRNSFMMPWGRRTRRSRSLLPRTAAANTATGTTGWWA